MNWLNVFRTVEASPQDTCTVYAVRLLRKTAIAGVCVGVMASIGGTGVVMAAPKEKPADNNTPDAKKENPPVSNDGNADNSKADPKKVPVGFSNLVVQLAEHDEIGMAGTDLKIKLIEHMRSRGFAAVGAENLVFNKDESMRALFQVGGTIRKVECSNRGVNVRCRIEVEWQVLDVSLDTVVYKVTTRTLGDDIAQKDKDKQPLMLIRKSLDALLEKPNFHNALLQKYSGGQQIERYEQVSFSQCSAISKPMPAGADEVLDATVMIRSGNGFGSGFFISQDGLILTAAHVVTSDTLTIRLRGGKEIQAVPIRMSTTADVALLRPLEKVQNQKCLATAKTDKVSIGSEIYAAGTPGKQELAFSMSRGILSGVRDVKGVGVLQTDAPINGGNSGGPLIDHEGVAVAVVSYKLTGKSVEGLGFGISIVSALTTLGLMADKNTTATLLAAKSVTRVPSTVTTFEDTADPVPSFLTEAEKEARQQENEKQQKIKDLVKQSRLSGDNMDDPDLARYARRKNMSKALYWGGIASVTIGASLVVVSVVAYDKQKSTYPEYTGLTVVNTTGWVLGGLGVAAFVVSFPVAPPITYQSNIPASTRVSLGVGRVSVEGAFLCVRAYLFFS